ncbi:MAG: hypothetical protein R3D68_13650 [Hyphomicrobiaceae bacterium]
MTEQLDTAPLGRLVEMLKNYSGIIVPLLAFLALLMLLSRLLGRGRDRRATGGVGSRITDAAVRAFTTNWQLTLLATTAFVLSLASGWTTWDGMRNFTGEPILSFMVTFGIQGVMLIIAWLIGESFASGMSQRSSEARVRSTGEWTAGMVAGGLLGLSVITAAAKGLGMFDMASVGAGGFTWWSLADKAVYIALAVLLLASLVINHKSEIAQPYVQSARIMAKNAVLWVMFLSCMATSVFFSFDSLFSSIFPQSERQRAAEIRASRQVAGIVADIGDMITRRQVEEADRLFKSGGWQAYERNLTELARQSQGAERDIEAYFVEQMEGRRRSIAEQQERISTAQSGQAGLAAKKVALTDELSRLKGERPTLASELTEKKTELDTRARGLDAKRVEAMAEERGAEGSLKIGKGPKYRERMGELRQLQDAFKIQEERVADAQKRLTAIDTRVAKIQRELAAIDGDIAKLTGETQTAETRIKAMEETRQGEEGPRVDPARVRNAFEKARADFQQDPNVEKLNVLATQCGQLHAAMLATPATKDRVRGIDCDPKPANEAGSRLFALNAGLESFAKHCSGGDKLPQSGGTDALLTFGRTCLQDSGLPSQDLTALATKISSIDLNRDDKAHRFVVTWNAFQDGNRLAYLALAIAIAIDSLVFMSGLFGANAVRSPLTDLEGRSELTADQLEGAIDATLRTTPDPMATLSGLLRALHPVSATDGFTSEIYLEERDPLVEDMRSVLVAGATIGAVRRVGADRSRYLVSAGLARYFAVAQRKSWRTRPADADKKELVTVIGVSLLPEPERNAAIVLSELHPISDDRGYSAEVYPFAIPDDLRRQLVLSTLGAGATIKGAVLRDQKDAKRYYVSPDFYRTLLLMRAGAIPAYRSQLPPPEARTAAAETVAVPLQAEPPLQITDASAATKARAARAPGTPPPLPSSDGEAGSFAQSVPAVAQTPDAAVDEPMPRVARAEPAVSPRDEAIVRSLGSRVRAELIQLGGAHPWSDREIDLAVAIGQNSEPERALRGLSGRAPEVYRRVIHSINEMRSGIQVAYDELSEMHKGEGLYLEVLETEAAKLVHLMPVLMLSPGGPYQLILEHDLIPQLEAQAGEGHLSSRDQLLLNRMRHQVEALKALSDTQRDRMERVVEIIDAYDERMPAQQAQNWEGTTGKRTLN